MWDLDKNLEEAWKKSQTLSFFPLPQVAEQADQEPHSSQVRTTDHFLSKLKIHVQSMC